MIKIIFTRLNTNFNLSMIYVLRERAAYMPGSRYLKPKVFYRSIIEPNDRETLL